MGIILKCLNCTEASGVSINRHLVVWVGNSSSELASFYCKRCILCDVISSNYLCEYDLSPLINNRSISRMLDLGQIATLVELMSLIVQFVLTESDNGITYVNCISVLVSNFLKLNPSIAFCIVSRSRGTEGICIERVAVVELKHALCVGSVRYVDVDRTIFSKVFAFELHLGDNTADEDLGVVSKTSSDCFSNFVLRDYFLNSFSSYSLGSRIESDREGVFACLSDVYNIVLSRISDIPAVVLNDLELDFCTSGQVQLSLCPCVNTISQRHVVSSKSRVPSLTEDSGIVTCYSVGVRNFATLKGNYDLGSTHLVCRSLKRYAGSRTGPCTGKAILLKGVTFLSSKATRTILSSALSKASENNARNVRLSRNSNRLILKNTNLVSSNSTLSNVQRYALDSSVDLGAFSSCNRTRGNRYLSHHAACEKHGSQQRKEFSHDVLNFS